MGTFVKLGGSAQTVKGNNGEKVVPLDILYFSKEYGAAP